MQASMLNNPTNLRFYFETESLAIINEQFIRLINLICYVRIRITYLLLSNKTILNGNEKK